MVNYEGQQFGTRIVVKNVCEDEDWLRIGKKVPSDKSKYVLCKCLNCSAVVPSDITNIKRQPPKRCVFCSNIGNHHNIGTNMNTWVVDNDIAICNVIYNGRVVSFFVDKDYYDTARKYTWRIARKKNKFYVVTGSNKKGTAKYLHHMILGIKEGYEIDHIDGNSLNNMKSNLRFVTHQENVDNIRATRIDNQIGVRGVSYCKRDKSYHVDFTYHDRRYYVRPWKSVEEAVYCRKCLEEHFGIEAVKHNPLAKRYELHDADKMNEINTYVLSKIS